MRRAQAVQQKGQQLDQQERGKARVGLANGGKLMRQC